MTPENYTRSLLAETGKEIFDLTSHEVMELTVQNFETLSVRVYSLRNFNQEPGDVIDADDLGLIRILECLVGVIDAIECVEHEDYIRGLGFDEDKGKYTQDWKYLYRKFNKIGWSIIAHRLEIDIDGLEKEEIVKAVLYSEQISYFENGFNVVYGPEDVREAIGIDGREWLMKHWGIKVRNHEPTKNGIIADRFGRIRERID